jgi:hypothetical protein
LLFSFSSFVFFIEVSGLRCSKIRIRASGKPHAEIHSLTLKSLRIKN